MLKCASCNGSLKESEIKCFQCDTPVPVAGGKISLPAHFRTIIKVTFIICAVMTVASLFLDFTPSFIKCIVATMVLGLAKSSCDQMSKSE